MQTSWTENFVRFENLLLNIPQKGQILLPNIVIYGIYANKTLNCFDLICINYFSENMDFNIAHQFFFFLKLHLYFIEILKLIFALITAEKTSF